MQACQIFRIDHSFITLAPTTRDRNRPGTSSTRAARLSTAQQSRQSRVQKARWNVSHIQALPSFFVEADVSFLSESPLF